MWSLEKNVTKNAKDINLGIELLPLTLPSKSLNKVNSTVLILLFFKLFIFPFPFLGWVQAGMPGLCFLPRGC